MLMKSTTLNSVSMLTGLKTCSGREETLTIHGHISRKCSQIFMLEKKLYHTSQMILMIFLLELELNAKKGESEFQSSYEILTDFVLVKSQLHSLELVSTWERFTFLRLNSI